MSSLSLSLSSLSSKKGIVALLDLPVRSALSIDGKCIQLKRDDFVGFSSLESSVFHLVTIQVFPDNDGKSGIGSSRHGITLLMDAKKDEWIVVHRYNPQTEETEPVTNTTNDTTIQSLEICIRKNKMGPPRIIGLDQLLSEEENKDWKRSTEFISKSLLQKRNLFHGCKVLPGAYHDDDDDDDDNEKMEQPGKIIDGNELEYPPIPILSTNDNNRRCKHTGTRRYLSTLKPSERTTVFLLNGSSSSLRKNNTMLDRILEEYYSTNWTELLGDLQLAYIMFLHLQCLSSLEHWRDLIAMLSFVEQETIESKPELYYALVGILNLQLKFIDRDFFEDLELSEGNFFLFRAIELLVTKMKACGRSRDDQEQFTRKGQELEEAATTLSVWFSRHNNDHNNNDDDDDNDDDEEEAMTGNNHQISHTTNHSSSSSSCMNHHPNNNDDDDDDGPVVVSTEDYEASLARSSNGRNNNDDYPLEHQHRYAMLFASMQPHEDIMMTCARALDTRVDVSLVREAAQYLEQEVGQLNDTFQK